MIFGEGLCGCGCGRETNLAKDSDYGSHVMKGEHNKYIQGHNAVLKKGIKVSAEASKNNSLGQKKRFSSGPESHPRWKGGTLIKRGYVYIHDRNHRLADINGYVKRSHWIIEDFLGPMLLSAYVVHHKNGIKTDDKLDNLAIMTRRDHALIHKGFTLDGKRKEVTK